ncbi:MAG: hypothetical protein EZS28_017235 [Streblomastix strix]|uniref:Uncharacterized protein n=1 Tax=Streblomastix strix TaxID=222440 RepID=A0A5J4VXF1_9EUKA|nr:MAG: hypothetical protein EZS28_017235 [Streblomastix strix]
MNRMNDDKEELFDDEHDNELEDQEELFDDELDDELEEELDGQPDDELHDNYSIQFLFNIFITQIRTNFILRNLCQFLKFGFIY